MRLLFPLFISTFQPVHKRWYSFFMTGRHTKNNTFFQLFFWWTNASPFTYDLPSYPSSLYIYVCYVEVERQTQTMRRYLGTYPKLTTRERLPLLFSTTLSPPGKKYEISRIMNDESWVSWNSSQSRRTGIIKVWQQGHSHYYWAWLEKSFFPLFIPNQSVAWKKKDVLYLILYI